MMAKATNGAGLVLIGCQRRLRRDDRAEAAFRLHLAPGATLAVLGRNGVGKTTLLATVMGHTRLHDGSIGFRGRDISALPIYQRAVLGLALVPQEREIFRSLTVEENLTVGAREGRWTLCPGLRLLSRAGGTAQQPRRSPIGRRAADARHRPCANGQSDLPVDGRTARGPRAQSSSINCWPGLSG